MLGYPDHTQTYILDTDSSGFGVGAVLSQEQDRKDMGITYYNITSSHQKETAVLPQ